MPRENGTSGDRFAKVTIVFSSSTVNADFSFSRSEVNCLGDIDGSIGDSLSCISLVLETLYLCSLKDFLMAEGFSVHGTEVGKVY